jgi:hypothetical protein
MKLERDPFRMDLRYAKLCMELDCNTVFDASTCRHCPTCGSIEFYPLESWLNRDRSQKAPGAETASLPSSRRVRWLWRLRGARVESEARAAAAPVKLRARAAQRRRAG